MGRLTGKKPAGKRPAGMGRQMSAAMVECRHVLESCSHRTEAARACGRYAVSGGRFGHLAGSLFL